MGEWRERRFGQLAVVLRRGTAPDYVEASAVRAIGQRCIRNEGFDPSAGRPHDDRVVATLRPDVNDVLINSTGTGTIGRSCVFDDERGQYMVDGHVTLVRPSKVDADGRFLNELVRSPDGQRFLESRCFTGSTNQIELSRTQLARMPVRMPPLEEQRRIAEILDTIDETIQATESVIAKLALARVGLLDALMKPGILGLPPPGWELLRLEQLLGCRTPAMRSGPFGSALLSAELVDDGVPLLGIDNVDRERFVTDFKRYVSVDKAQELSRYRVFPRDLMITIMGTVGKCCVVPDNIGHALSSKHVWTLTLDGERYLPELACLQINYSSWALAHFSQGEQGGIMSAIRSETLRSLPLPTPPLAEQERIWAVLSDSTCRLAKERVTVEKLRLTRSGLAADLLSGRVRTVEA